MTWFMRLACLTAALLICSPVQAAETIGTEVTFTTPPIPPTPFKAKRAKAKGITLEPTPGTEVTGTLYSPVGDGPFPAMIILVSGDGVRESHHNWARLLTEWGYISLLVDSFASRGGTNFYDTPSMNVEADGFGAYIFLAAMDTVLADKIGYLGFSLGASRLFRILDPENRLKPEGFAPSAGIGFYPLCPSNGKTSSPMFILLGDQDRQADLTSCQAFADASPEQTTLQVYPGLTHSFDNPEYGPSYERTRQTDQTWYTDLDYDEAGHVDSMNRVRGYLHNHLQ